MEWHKGLITAQLVCFKLVQIILGNTNLSIVLNWKTRRFQQERGAWARQLQNSWMMLFMFPVGVFFLPKKPFLLVAIFKGWWYSGTPTVFPQKSEKWKPGNLSPSPTNMLLTSLVFEFAANQYQFTARKSCSYWTGSPVIFWGGIPGETPRDTQMIHPASLGFCRSGMISGTYLARSKIGVELLSTFSGGKVLVQDKGFPAPTCCLHWRFEEPWYKKQEASEGCNALEGVFEAIWSDKQHMVSCHFGRRSTVELKHNTCK